MKKLIERILIHTFKRKARKEMQQRRFDFLQVLLYSCKNQTHLYIFDKRMKEILMPEDLKTVQYSNLYIEILKVEGIIFKSESMQQDVRIYEGEQILKSLNIK